MLLKPMLAYGQVEEARGSGCSSMKHNYVDDGQLDFTLLRLLQRHAPILIPKIFGHQFGQPSSRDFPMGISVRVPLATFHDTNRYALNPV